MARTNAWIWGNLAEEIDDLGKSVRRELQSQIRRIVRHLLKLAFASKGTAPCLGGVHSGR
jgi:hypothetical protein